MDLDYDAYPSFTELTLYVHRHGSIPVLLSSEVLGYADRRATPRFAHEAGALLLLFERFYDIRHHAQHGRFYIPEDEMRRFGVDPGDLLAAQTTERVRQLFAFQAERLADYQRRALELLPECDRHAQCSLLVRLELVQTLLAECRQALGGWLAGMTISAVVVFLTTWAGLALLKVPLALLSALGCGLLTFVPTIGPTAATLLPLAVSLLVSPAKVLQVLVLRLVLQNGEAFLLTPMLLSRTVNLLPTVALMSQLCLGALLGLPGILLALSLIHI